MEGACPKVASGCSGDWGPCRVYVHASAPWEVCQCLMKGVVGAVIKNFGSQIGADVKQVQGLIRLAKKNGEKLGFLS